MASGLQWVSYRIVCGVALAQLATVFTIGDSSSSPRCSVLSMQNGRKGVTADVVKSLMYTKLINTKHIW